MSTNEELAQRIKAGDHSLYGVLWEQIRRFALKQASGWMQRGAGRYGVDVSDLTQAGFLALVPSCQHYDPARAAAFISVYAWYLRAAFAEACGISTRQQASDPLNSAERIEAPAVSTEDDSYTVGDTIQDPEAAAQFERVLEEAESSALRAVLGQALDLLPPEQKAAVWARYGESKTIRTAAAQLHTSVAEQRSNEQKGLRALRYGPSGKILSRWRMDVISASARGVGVTAFRQRQASSVEVAVMRLEQ